MDYKSKARELRSITRELRLLNPCRREQQLKEDEFIESIKNIAIQLRVGTITAEEAMFNSWYNFHRFLSQPMKPRHFKQGGFIHPKINLEDQEPIIPRWMMMASYPIPQKEFIATYISQA